MAKQLYPCLWFDGKAREAADFYCTIFPNSKITNDSGMVVNFELNGSQFMGLNGGDNYKFNEAVSFVVPCKDQDEIDHYWYKLIADGGEESMCGWCKDKFGLSWQVIPDSLGKLLNGQKAVQAFMKMKKIDIEILKNA